MVPGQFFPSFREAIRHERDEHCFTDTGHGCWNAVARRAAAAGAAGVEFELGLLLGGAWVPSYNSRQETPLGCLVPARDARFKPLPVEPRDLCSLFPVQPGEALGASLRGRDRARERQSLHGLAAAQRAEAGAGDDAKRARSSDDDDHG